MNSSLKSAKRKQRYTSHQDQLAILVKSRIPSTQMLHDLLSLQQASKKTHQYLDMLLKDAKLNSEEHIIQQLEITNNDPKALIKIRSLVNKVLLDSLFLIEYEKLKVPEQWIMEYECMKLLFQAKVLIRDGLRNNGVDLLTRLIRTAEYYSFTSILLEAFSLLRNHYSLMGKTTLANKIYKKIVSIQNSYVVELEMQNLLSEVLANINSSALRRAHFRPRFETIFKRVEEIKLKHDSPQILLYFFLISANYLYYKEDFKSIVALCDQVENEITKLQRTKKVVRVNEIAFFKANALMRIGKYSEAIKYIKKSIGQFAPESPKWIKMQEEYFINALYLENYELAHEVLRSVAPWRKDAKMTNPTKEKWMINILFLSLQKELPNNYFFIENFLTSNVELSRDKLGYNILIQLLLIIKTIENNELDIAYQQLKALIKSRNRIKQVPQNVRLNIVLKSMSRLLQNPYSKKKLVLLEKIVSEGLKKNPPLNEYYSEFEILPYEKIWKIVTRTVGKLQTSRKTSLLVSKKGS